MVIARATLTRLIGLFVGDWSQAIGILVILGLGYVALRFTPMPMVGFVVAAALAAHLVYTSLTEARRRVRRG